MERHHDDCFIHLMMILFLYRSPLYDEYIDMIQYVHQSIQCIHDYIDERKLKPLDSDNVDIGLLTKEDISQINIITDNIRRTFIPFLGELEDTHFHVRTAVSMILIELNKYDLKYYTSSSRTEWQERTTNVLLYNRKMTDYVDQVMDKTKNKCHEKKRKNKDEESSWFNISKWINLDFDIPSIMY